MLRSFLLLCCFSILLGAVPQPARAGDEEQAKSYIQGLASQTLTIIQKKNSKNAKKKELENLFAKNVDIPWVGRFVMGRYWRTTNDAQKKRYLSAYQDFILSHYANRFTEYTSGAFDITGTTQDGEGEYTVNMELVDPKKPNDQPILVDYRVRKEGSGFMVFDVSIEGVSMITTQRSEFASVISRNGVDYLIDQLANKTMQITTK